MPQTAVEDYLKTVHTQIRKPEPTGRSWPVTWLGVYAPAVSAMLREQRG